MSANQPAYVKQLPRTGPNNHTLTDAEYADFQALHPFLYLLTDTDGRIVTTDSGEFIFGTH